MADPRLRSMKIKTGVVTRITKEKTSYEKETQSEKDRLQKFKEQGDQLDQVAHNSTRCIYFKNLW